MKKEMLINVLQPEECRIAILENNVLEELYVERTSQESYVGNIYKGRIVNIEPSIQAAFVDFGIGRNGFLHVSDVDPAYYKHLEFPRGRDDRGRGRNRYEDRGRGEDRGPRPEHRREAPVERSEMPRQSPAVSPPPEGERPFGAGLFDDEPTSSADVQAPAVEHEPVDANDEDAEAEPKKRRRRGRRRGKKKTSDPAAVEGGVVETGAGDDESDNEPEDGPPKLDSAERRTDEDDEPFAVESSGNSEESDETDESDAESSDLDESDTEDEDGQPRQRRDHDRGRRGRHKMGRDGTGRPKPPIQEFFKRGQEVLVQVIKEGIGTKGPTLSTYISIAGRYLVLMPGLNRIGVSRKIDDEDARRRLKDILNELHPPQGVGFIIRTAGIDKNKKELQNDLAYLLRIWQVVTQRVRRQKAPAACYQESDMITRTIRDTFTSDIDTIWVDEAGAFAHAQEFLKAVMPRYANRLRHYESSEPLFHKYKLEEEIIRIQQKKVPLPHGGSIVIEQTEALVAIDVNSGSFRAENNAEETAFQMNLHAAKEIARQLRLRDLGGVIVNDFIDMREDKHRRAVEKAMRDAVKRDRARTKVLKISAFGIIEMTRQRIRPSLKRSVYQDCPFCRGNGHVKTCESMSIEVMRLVQLAAHKEQITRVQVRVQSDVADYLLNRKRREVAQLEEAGNMQVAVVGMIGAPPESLELTCYDNNNNEVRLLPAPEPQIQHHRGRGHRR
ncbi:MAG: Rne/Rng family ribonuclease [Gemmataceae bacterium]